MTWGKLSENKVYQTLHDSYLSITKIGSDDDARQLHFWLLFSCFKVYIDFSQLEDEEKIVHDVWL